MEATTRADIDDLFDDLPAPHPDLSANEPPAVLTRPEFEAITKQQETPLSNTMFAVFGVLLVLGVPAAIIAGVSGGAWWILAAVLGAALVFAILGGSLIKRLPDE